MATVSATTRAVIEQQWVDWARISWQAGDVAGATLDLVAGAAALATYDLGGAA